MQRNSERRAVEKDCWKWKCVLQWRQMVAGKAVHGCSGSPWGRIREIVYRALSRRLRLRQTNRTFKNLSDTGNEISCFVENCYFSVRNNNPGSFWHGRKLFGLCFWYRHLFVKYMFLLKYNKVIIRGLVAQKMEIWLPRYNFFTNCIFTLLLIMRSVPLYVTFCSSTS